MSGRPAGPRLAVRLLAVALGLVVTLVGFEVAWRLTEWIVRGVPVISMLPDYRDTQFQLSPFLVFGPRIDHQIGDRAFPEQAYFDSAGFRTNEPVGAKPEGEYRIIAVGGSTTENYRNEAGLHWPLVLECRLRAAGRPQVRVLNTGMSAYSTAHSLIRLELDLLDYDPDMVIVLHAINDLNVTYRAKAAGLPVDGHYRSKYVIRHFTNGLTEDDVVLLRSWHAVRRLLTPAPIVSGPVEGYELQPGLRYFERNLRSIAALLASRSVRGVFLTMPFDPDRVDAHRSAPENAGLVYLPSRAALIADMGEYARTTLDVARTSPGVTSVDMAALFPRDSAAFLDIVHFTTDGVVRFGDILAGALLDEIPEYDGKYELSGAAERRCAW